jgi:hypothetical protein
MPATPITLTPTASDFIRDDGLRRREQEKELRSAHHGFAPYFGREGVLEQPELAWALEGIIQDYSVNMLFGESETYKTFFALDWAFTLSDPELKNWHGHAKDRDFRPLYVFSEGRAGLRKRQRAWELNKEREVRGAADGVVWLFDTVDMMQYETKDRYGQTVITTSEPDWARLMKMYDDSGCNMLVLDTLSSTMRGDTNSNADAQRYMDTLTEFTARGPVLVTHHTQKADKNEYRGASVFQNSSDVMLRTKQQGKTTKIELDHYKFKEGAKVVIGTFDKKINTEVDSMSLELVAAGDEELTERQEEILEALREMKSASSQDLADAGLGKYRSVDGVLNRLRDGQHVTKNGNEWSATLEVIE